MSERLYRVRPVIDDATVPDCVMDSTAKSEDDWDPIFKPMADPAIK
jgi:hypothetical protein